MASSVSSRNLRRRITTLIVLIFVIAVIVAFATSLSQLNRLQREHEQLVEEFEQGQVDLHHLQEEYEYSQTEGFIRRMARELLGWVEPGDTKIVDGSKE